MGEAYNPTYTAEDPRAAAYPTVGDILPDRRMVRSLMHSYYAELDAVSTYLYNSILCEQDAPALSALFESLAEAEAIHYTLLGKAICRLGGNPSIHTELHLGSPIGKRDYPNPPASPDTRRMLRQALTAEQMAAREYRLLSSRTPDPALARLLERLSRDEETHARLLRTGRGQL